MPAKKKPRKRTARIKVDLSEWEWGEWPDQLWECVTVEKHKYMQGLDIELNLNPAMFEKAAAKIAKEAIETYVNDASWSISKKGLVVRDNQYNHEFTIPMGQLYLTDPEAAEKLQALINKTLAEWRRAEENDKQWWDKEHPDE